MALGEEGGSNGIPATMLVSPTGFGGNNTMPYPVPMYGMMGGGNGNNGFGDGGWWIVLLIIIIAAMGGWGNNGNGGGIFGGGNSSDFPWLMNGQQGINNNVSDGFRDAQLHDSVTSVRDGISALSTQLCNCCGDMQMSLANGFSGVNATINGAQNALAQQMYTNQIADMERSFAAQTASTQGMNAIQAQLAQCCCDNRAATADVKYTIATEACATRTANTANTQAILDKLCALELDNYKRENDNLRTQLNMATLTASQTAQTAALRAGQNDAVDSLYNRLMNCPIPAEPVFGRQPIFQCNNGGYGCGCGCNG